jgi:hypothetical protein
MYSNLYYTLHVFFFDACPTDILSLKDLATRPCSWDVASSVSPLSGRLGGLRAGPRCVQPWKKKIRNTTDLRNILDFYKYMIFRMDLQQIYNRFYKISISIWYL